MGRPPACPLCTYPMQRLAVSRRERRRGVEAWGCHDLDCTGGVFKTVARRLGWFREWRLWREVQREHRRRLSQEDVACP